MEMDGGWVRGRRAEDRTNFGACFLDTRFVKYFLARFQCVSVSLSRTNDISAKQIESLTAYRREYAVYANIQHTCTGKIHIKICTCFVYLFLQTQSAGTRCRFGCSHYEWFSHQCSAIITVPLSLHFFSSLHLRDSSTLACLQFGVVWFSPIQINFVYLLNRIGSAQVMQ